MKKESEILLQIRDLSVEYQTEDGIVKAVNGIDLNVGKGETVGLVGETGAGKTTVALSILRLIPDPPGRIVRGEILWKGKDLLKESIPEMQKIRGDHISMIFQDPMTALNPVHTIGEQIAESVILHQNLHKKEAEEAAKKTLELVGIPKERYFDYPHQFSGGMKQRVVIAIALACNPELLIADEPTTALDVTIQAQILEMMNQLKRDLGMSVIMITHDLGIVAEMCDRVAVVYAGQIVEWGTTRQVFKNTYHPYTLGLFGSLPDMKAADEQDFDERRLKPISGMMPDPTKLPDWCHFAERCPYRTDECEKDPIPLRDFGDGHLVRCRRCPVPGKEE
ncbi:ABC transporter ATP-binding protein [Cuneatibacter sp. NSJ-177]|uniref:ABC transporter ATP-binding protein n=1 Tax=Cuneatibacter sp. NSJ-177 TaxID=2931401 RepID=UPI001FD28039|nr:ABC transporter ATP-binding protein [Cuneatibacter sp. NSJ-177]MCJ7834796.1 ABC transporter ATP-binding protein [Cuneatibacter sp. NSJ-177]